jgi:hypothetical protein
MEFDIHLFNWNHPLTMPGTLLWLSAMLQFKSRGKCADPSIHIGGRIAGFCGLGSSITRPLSFVLERPEYCNRSKMPNERSIRQFEVTISHQTHPKHPTHQGWVVVSLPMGWLLNSIPFSQIFSFISCTYEVSNDLHKSNQFQLASPPPSPPWSNLV